VTEFEDRPIPRDSRKAAWKITSVSLGLTAVVVNMLVGGVLGASMDRTSWLVAILGGGAVLAVIAAMTANFSYSSGQSFALQTRTLFGEPGSKLVAAMVGLIILGWFTIQSSLLGATIATFFNMSPSGQTAVLLLLPFAIAWSAAVGFSGLTRVSVVAVPAILILSALALFFASDASSGPADGAFSIPVAQGLGMVLSLWIMGAVATIGDITRYARTRAEAVSSAVLAFLIGNTGLMLAGAWCAERGGTGDLSAILEASGFLFLGLVLLTANIWSTNDNAIYSVALNWSYVARVKYRIALLVAAVVSSAAALLRPHESEVLSSWLTALGVFVPPLGGSIVGCRLGSVPSSPIAGGSGLGFGIMLGIWNPYDLGPVLGLIGGIVGAAVMKCLVASRRS